MWRSASQSANAARDSGTAFLLENAHCTAAIGPADVCSSSGLSPHRQSEFLLRGFSTSTEDVDQTLLRLIAAGFDRSFQFFRSSHRPGGSEPVDPWLGFPRGLAVSKSFLLGKVGQIAFVPKFRRTVDWIRLLERE